MQPRKLSGLHTKNTFSETASKSHETKAATPVRHDGLFALGRIVGLGPRSTTAATESITYSNRPRCAPVQFKLCAYFLDLRGLRFELRGQNFHPMLLLGARRL